MVGNEIELKKSGDIVREDARVIADTTEDVNLLIKKTKVETEELNNLDGRLGQLESAMHDRKVVASRVREKIQRIDCELI